MIDFRSIQGVWRSLFKKRAIDLELRPRIEDFILAIKEERFQEKFLDQVTLFTINKQLLFNS